MQQKDDKKILWHTLAFMAFSTVWGFGNVINGFSEYGGLKAIVSWILIFAIYFVPYALMVGELGSTFKHAGGGVSSWIHETIGPKMAYYAGWTYWVVHMPYISQKPNSTVIAASWALFQDKRASGMNTTVMQILCLVIFLFAMYLSGKGMGVLKRLATLAGSAMFIMSMPLASIRESVALSNRFTTWVGLIVLVFGSIMMCFVTNRITKPIMKLSALSEEMSKLNFDVSYEDDAEDEVGVLGRSMNSLSHSLKDAIGALQDANKQLQHDIDEKIQIDEMRKEFIANVSHELKTPIALIQGYAEGLCDGMCEDEESRSYYCEVIMDEANKMNKMVRQLLTLTALEFGNDTPSISAFDVTELVHDLINSSGILIQQNAAKVSVDMPETLVVMGDEFKIEEVVTNYLTNAMNHLGGDHNIRIWSETLDGVAKIHVYNNGTPIPEEDLPNLWTKFYKVDKARTRAYGGSGIGLSIVKAIMEAHHQQYGVVNHEDGVEFWFTLALASEKPEEEE